MQIRKLRKYQVIELSCDELVADGLGLCHLDQELQSQYKPVTGFVFGVLPKERFLARVMQVKSGFFHAVLLTGNEIPEEWVGQTDISFDKEKHWALTNENEKRIEPDCENFVLCGGCRLRHLSYSDTLEYKKKWLQIQLERNHVKIPEIETVTSESETQYRNNVQVHINKYEQRGFYAPYTYRTVQFPEHGCRIFNQKAFDETFPEKLKLDRVVRSRYDHITGYTGHWSLNTKEDKAAKFTYHIQYPHDAITAVTIPNTAFFQVNTESIPGWLSLINRMLSVFFPEEDQQLKVIELFSGVGFITTMLSSHRQITSIGIDILKPGDLHRVKFQRDVDIENLNSGQSHKKDHGQAVSGLFKYIQADLTRIEETISDEDCKELQNFDAETIIMNPPRGGFKPDQAQWFFDHCLTEFKGPVVYSSCSGATFARDAAFFRQQGYAIDQVYLLDFFPFTAHYEILALFTRDDRM